MKRIIFNRVSLFSFILLLFPYILLAEDIPLIKQGGIYWLPVEINGVITLSFILDTGASEVNIPADVALTLYRTGTIRNADFLPGQTYTLADGSKVNSSRFVLRHLKIGQRRTDNVAASVGDVSSPLLLGQSFLEKLGTWGIDSQKQVLTIGTRAQREEKRQVATYAHYADTDKYRVVFQQPLLANDATRAMIGDALQRFEQTGQQTPGMQIYPLSNVTNIIPVLGNAHTAITFLTQMLTIAMQNGGEGQEAQLEALKQQIEVLPKPMRGDRKAARLHNDKGLEAFKQEQHDQALQSFLTAYQLDASDVEVVNNVGVAYLKTGNLEEAARYLGGALSLAPNRATAWANLAEVFAHGSHPGEAVAAYALTYRFSKNKDATRRLLEAQTTNVYDPQVMQAAKAALALSFIK